MLKLPVADQTVTLFVVPSRLPLTYSRSWRADASYTPTRCTQTLSVGGASEVAIGNAAGDAESDDGHTITHRSTALEYWRWNADAIEPSCDTTVWYPLVSASFTQAATVNDWSVRRIGPATYAALTPLSDRAPGSSPRWPAVDHDAPLVSVALR